MNSHELHEFATFYLCLFSLAESMTVYVCHNCEREEKEA